MTIERPPLHYEIETLPDGRIAIWRTSKDNKKVYSVTEIMPKPEPQPPEPTDQLAALLKAMADMDDAQ
jgi:hypothetical protein